MNSAGNRIALALSVLAALFLVGVIYAGLTLPQRPQPVEYTLTIDARAEDGRVLAHGTTNLPEGSRLSVVVERLYRIRGSGTWQLARVGEEHVEVRDGAWSADVAIDDETWVHQVAERVNTREIDPVEEVQPGLKATVVFSPLIPQVGFVWESMGSGFQALSESEAAHQTGGQWLLIRETTVHKPLQLDLEKRILQGS